MKKIPTVFRRDPENMRHLLPEVHPDCGWVLAGEGTPTRKFDGTCVMFDGSDWWARREVKRGKAEPPNFQAVTTDDATGKTMGWEPIAQSGFAKWHAEALAYYVMYYGEGVAAGTYELCGPRVNGNPEDMDGHRLFSHADADRLTIAPRMLTFEGLREVVLLLKGEGFEGVVWHHSNGRMAKLKGKDFA